MSKQIFVENYLYENVFHKIQFHFHPHQTHFHMKGSAQGLVLKHKNQVTIHFVLIVIPIPWCCNKRSNSSFATAIRS